MGISDRIRKSLTKDSYYLKEKKEEEGKEPSSISERIRSSSLEEQINARKAEKLHSFFNPEVFASDYSDLMTRVGEASTSWQKDSSLIGIQNSARDLSNRMGKEMQAFDLTDKAKDSREYILSQYQPNSILNRRKDDPIIAASLAEKRNRVSMSNTKNDLDSIASGTADLRKVYSQFNNGEDYNKAVKKNNIVSKYDSASYEDIKKGIETATDPEEKAYLENYSTDVGYKTAKDYDLEIEDIQKDIDKATRDISTAQGRGNAKAKAQALAKKRELENQKTLITSLRDKFKRENMYGYSYLTMASDFEEKSKNNFSCNDITTGDMGMGKKAVVSGSGRFVGEYEYLDLMKDDEKAILSYLITRDEEDGTDRATAYLDAIHKTLSERDSARTRTAMQKTVDDSVVGSAIASIASVGINAISAIPATVETISNNLLGTNSEKYNNIYDVGQMAREEVGNNIEEEAGSVPRFLYDIGLSMADSGVGVLMGSQLGAVGENIHLGIMGASAANSRMKELEEQGASKAQILIGGGLTGVAEALFEKVSLDKLLSEKSVATVGDKVKAFFMQAFTEGSEEVNTELANFFTDQIVRGSMSDYNQSIREYMKQGYSKEEAKQMATQDFIKQVVLAGVGGAISGGIMGGADVAIRSSQLSKTGAEIRKNDGAVDNLKTIAQNMGKDSESFKKAESLRENLSEKASNIEAAELYETVMNDLQTKVSEAGKSIESKTVDEYASEMQDEKMRDAFKKNYDGNSNADTYYSRFSLIYELGMAGASTEDVMRYKGNLSAKAVTSIYAAGVRANTSNVRATQQELDAITKKYFKDGDTSGKFTLEDNVAKLMNSNKLSETQKSSIKFLEKLSSVIGANITVFASEKQQNGEYGAEQGWYDAETNTIYIDAYSGVRTLADGTLSHDSIINVAAHELTHWAETKSPALYNELKSVVIGGLAKADGVTNMQYILNKAEELKQRYKNAGIKMDSKTDWEALAVSESIAEACDGMLTDKKVAGQYLAKMSQKQRVNFATKIKEYIDKVRAWIKDLLPKYKDTSSYEAKTLRSIDESYAKAQKIWANMIESASRTNQALEKAALSEKSNDVLYNVRFLTEEDKFDALYGGKRERNTEVVIISSRAELLGFIKQSIKGKLTNTMGVYGKVDERLAKEVKRFDSNLNIEGMYLELSADDLRHAYKHSQTNDNYEDDMPLEWGDIIDSIEDVNRCDVERIEHHPNGRVAIHLSKYHGGGIVHTIEIVSKSYNSVRLKTMFKNTVAGYIKKRSQWNTAGNESSSTAHDSSASKNKISQNELSVNNKQRSVRADVTELTDEYYNDLKDYFGKTYSWNETGYLLKDGTRLDFSGKNNGAQGGYRTVDHRDVWDAHENPNTDGVSEMVNMISNGNIRVMPETAGLNIAVMPTKAQFDKIYDFVQKNKGEVIIDIDEVGGDTIHSFEYPLKTNAYKIIGDIKAYFENGTMPNIVKDEFANFRYSIRPDNTASLTDETMDKMLANYAASNPNYAQAYITYMRPDDFLKLTTTKRSRIAAESRPINYDDLTEVQRGQAIHLSIFENEDGEWEVDGHEGRHRMYALMEDGVENVPVLIFDSSNKYSKEEHSSAVLVQQDFGNSDYEGLKVTIGQTIPFSTGNKETIRNMFGEKSKASRQFSIRESEQSTYDLVGENKRLESENKKLAKDLENLRKLRKLDKTLTHGTVLKEDALKRAARQLIEKSGINYDAVTLTDKLRDLYAILLDRDGVDSDAFNLNLSDLARELAGHAIGFSEKDTFNKEIMERIRKTKIKISESQKQEAIYSYGGYKEFQRATFGKMNLSTKEGIPLDSFYTELQMEYPWIFSEVVDAEQIYALEQAYTDMRQSLNEVREYYDAELERYLSAEIFNQFWQIPTIQTTADKHEHEINGLRLHHHNMMQEMRENHKATVEEYKKKGQAYRDKISTIIKQKNARIEEARRLGNVRMNAYKDRQARRAEIKKITDRAKTLAKWLTKNSEKEHVPDVFKEPVANLLKAIDFSSERLLGHYGGDLAGKPTNKDISLASAFAGISKVLTGGKDSGVAEDASTYLGNFIDLPQGFIADMAALNERITKISTQVGDDAYVLNEMTLEELQKLRETITILKTSVTKANKLLAGVAYTSAVSAAQDTMADMEKYGDKGNDPNKLNEFLNYSNALPVYMFDRLGRGGKAMFEEVQNGWDKFAFNVKEVLDFSEDTYTKKEVKEWSKEVHEYTTVAGYKLKITTPQLMSLYCLSMREQAEAHIKQGGIIVDTFKDGRHDVTQSDKRALSDTDIDNLLGMLTERQTEVAQKLQEFMATRCADWGNEVSMARFGIKLFGEEHYFPIESDTNFLRGEDKPKEEQNNSLFRLLNMAFTKPLTEKANNPIIVRDIFDVFANHSSDMAKYNALALPTLDMYKWYSYQEKTPMLDANGEVMRDEEGKVRMDRVSVKHSIDKALGASAKRYITTFLQDLNGAHSGGREEGFQNKLMSMYKVGAVAFNLRVALLQPTAYFRASAILNASDLAYGMRHTGGNAKAMKYSGIANWKDMGFYDTNVQRNVQSLIKQDAGVVDKIVEIGMKGAEWGDKLTWGHLWYACEHAVARENKALVKDSEEFNKAVADKFRDVVYRTQVADSTMTRSQYMRSKSGLVKLVTAFMSEPTVSFNLLSSKAQEFALAKRQYNASTALKMLGRGIAKTSIAYLVTALANALMEALVDAWRYPESEDEDATFGEKYTESFGNKFFENFIEDMAILNKVPIFKDMYDTLKVADLEAWVINEKRHGNEVTGADIGTKYKKLLSSYYSNARMDEAVFDSIRKTLSMITKLMDGDSVQLYSTVYNAAQAISQTSGIPIAPLWREFSTIWNNTIGEAYPSKNLKNIKINEDK